MAAETVKVGQRGTVVIPADLRKEYGIEEGSVLIAESVAEGILFQPVFSMEIYSPERKAEFLLNNAVKDEDYAWAVNEVRKLGLDPEKIPHEKFRK